MTPTMNPTPITTASLVRPDYVPIWARPNNPTIGMSESEMRAYWKAHAVLYDAMFMLRGDAHLPADLETAWRRLFLTLDPSRKETPADRQTRDQLRTATRQYRSGQRYQLPEPSTVVSFRPTRKPRPRTICPHCGQ